MAVHSFTHLSRVACKEAFAAAERSRIGARRSRTRENLRLASVQAANGAAATDTLRMFAGTNEVRFAFITASTSYRKQFRRNQQGQELPLRCPPGLCKPHGVRHATVSWNCLFLSLRSDDQTATTNPDSESSVRLGLARVLRRGVIDWLPEAFPCSRPQCKERPCKPAIPFMQHCLHPVWVQGALLLLRPRYMRETLVISSICGPNWVYRTGLPWAIMPSEGMPDKEKQPWERRPEAAGERDSSREKQCNQRSAARVEVLDETLSGGVISFLFCTVLCAGFTSTYNRPTREARVRIAVEIHSVSRPQMQHGASIVQSGPFSLLDRGWRLMETNSRLDCSRLRGGDRS